MCPLFEFGHEYTRTWTWTALLVALLAATLAIRRTLFLVFPSPLAMALSFESMMSIVLSFSQILLCVGAEYLEKPCPSRHFSVVMNIPSIRKVILTALFYLTNVGTNLIPQGIECLIERGYHFHAVRQKFYTSF